MKEEESIISEPLIEEFIRKYEIRRIHIDFFERLIFLIIAGLGLITALAWDVFFKDFFIEIFGHIDSTDQKLLYAVLLTFLTVVVTIFLRKCFKRRK
ncbi:MAG: DUF5654 family protein [Patescibacteria group bacterium]